MFLCNFLKTASGKLTSHLPQIRNHLMHALHKFYSFDDFKKQLAVHNRNYNNFPMRPLNWKAPSDYVKAFIRFGEVF